MGSNKISTIDLEEPVVETLNTIDTVADQVTVVSGNTNTILTTVQDNNAKISAINANVDSVNVNVDNSKTMIENMEARINEMENNINAGFQQNKLDSNSISAALSGASSPYGTGILGDVVYDPSTFLWGTPDHLGRYMLYAESFTVPEGVTMTPPARCNGVYIFSKGDVTINGTIDLRSKRILSANVSIPDTITVDGVEYALAKGGDSQKGGNGGASGGMKVEMYNNWAEATITLTGTSKSSQDPIPGSVCGGGYGTYGKGGTSVSTTGSYDYYTGVTGTPSSKTSTASIGTNTSAACALVIIAHGNVLINGDIVSNGSGGKSATSGGNNLTVSSGNGDSRDYIGDPFTLSTTATTGAGGDGTCPPCGGGPVTIICEHLEMTGYINTKGSKIVSASVSNGGTASNSDHTLLYGNWDSQTEQTVYSTVKSQTVAQGGEALTCISTAGEIKIYERGAA